MPTYDYKCAACGHELEVFQKITESPKRKCPACKKSRLRRQIGGGAGFLFKGSGFYLTDYRSDGYKKDAAADKPASPASDSKGGDQGAKDGAKEKKSEPAKKAPAKDTKGKGSAP